MSINVFVYLGVIFAAAYVVKYLTHKLKIPEVTGYVLLGTILGVSVIRFLNQGVLDELQPISTVALGIIAFIIGVELRLDNLKKLGMSVLAIVILEGFGAFASVTLVLYYVANQTIELSLLLGAVAAATAPAATVAVIRQYKAKGTLTSTILAVVGIDDTIALVIYVFVSSFVKSSLTGIDANLLSILGTAFLSIGLSLLVGIVLSLAYILVLRKVRNNEWIEVLLAAFLLLTLGVSEELGISELLSMMVFGSFVVNASPGLAKRSMGIVEWFSPLFLAAFFVLGGAHLNFGLILDIGFIGILFFLARSAGKIGGASLGAVIGRASKEVKKFIGFALLPQVGVALALALAINKDFNIPRFGDVGAHMASVVINVLLLTTILTEIVGPILTRTALTRAGETGLQERG